MNRKIVTFIVLSGIMPCWLTACSGSDEEKTLKVSPLQVSELLDKNVDSHTKLLERGANDLIIDSMMVRLIDSLSERSSMTCGQASQEEVGGTITDSLYEDVAPIGPNGDDIPDEADIDGVITDISSEDSASVVPDRDEITHALKKYKEYLSMILAKEKGELDSAGTTIYYDLDPQRVCGGVQACESLLRKEPFFLRVVRPASVDISGYNASADNVLKVYLDHGSRDEAKTIGWILLADGRIDIDFDLGVWGGLAKDLARRDFKLSNKVLDRLDATKMQGVYHLAIGSVDDTTFKISIRGSDTVFGTTDYVVTAGEMTSEWRFKQAQAGAQDAEATRQSTDAIDLKFDSRGLNIGLKLKSLCDQAREAGFSRSIISECVDAEVDDDLLTVVGLDLGFDMQLTAEKVSFSDVRMGDILSVDLLGKNVLSVFARKSPESDLAPVLSDVSAELIHEEISGESVPYFRIAANEGFGFHVDLNTTNLPETLVEELAALGSDLGSYIDFFLSESAEGSGVDLSVPVGCAAADSAETYPVILRSGGSYYQDSYSEREGLSPGRLAATTGPVCVEEITADPGSTSLAADLTNSCDGWAVTN